MVGGALVFIRGSGFFFTGREVLGSCVQEGRDVMSDGKGIIAPKCLRCFPPEEDPRCGFAAELGPLAKKMQENRLA